MRRQPTRRSHTRWILLAGALSIATLVLGAVWLESIHPQLDHAGHAVAGVPPLAGEQTTSCRVELDQGRIDELHRDFPVGGRVSSTQVYLCPSAYDGLEVTYVGEVVGDILRRRGGAWVQVNDDAYALTTGPVLGHRERSGFNTGLSVWLEGDLAERIEAPGRPARRGDVLQLTGTILRADPDDGGGITLRATTLQTLAPPVELDPPLHTIQLIVAIILSALAIATTWWARQRRRA